MLFFGGFFHVRVLYKKFPFTSLHVLMGNLNNDDDNDDDDDNNNNNKNSPVALKYRDDIRRGIVKYYGQMQRSLALVGNHLQMVSR